MILIATEVPSPQSDDATWVPAVIPSYPALLKRKGAAGDVRMHEQQNRRRRRRSRLWGADHKPGAAAGLTVDRASVPSTAAGRCSGAEAPRSSAHLPAIHWEQPLQSIVARGRKKT